MVKGCERQRVRGPQTTSHQAIRLPYPDEDRIGPSWLNIISFGLLFHRKFVNSRTRLPCSRQRDSFISFIVHASFASCDRAACAKQIDLPFIAGPKPPPVSGLLTIFTRVCYPSSSNSPLSFGHVTYPEWRLFAVDAALSETGRCCKLWPIIRSSSYHIR